MKSSWGLVVVLSVLMGAWPICASAQDNPKVVLETNFGDIVIELFPDDAPITVDNFLGYVNSGFYDGLLFHRVIEGFMIQGGGYYIVENTIYSRQTGGPIINESYNGLSNIRGTIAMARSDEPNSATSQFFINHVDNTGLDREDAPGDFGYCVFGQVVSGMNVVDAIAQTSVIDLFPGDPFDPFNNFPYDPMVGMYSAYVRSCELSYCGDISYDGKVNLEDFTIFASRWLDNDCNSANDFCGGTDLDYNGSSDVYDLSLFVDKWLVPVGFEPEASDITGDGEVNFEDFAILESYWLDTGCNIGNNFCGRADLNRNSTVEFFDFALFSRNWRTSIE